VDRDAGKGSSYEAEEDYESHIPGDAGAEAVYRDDYVYERKSSSLREHAYPNPFILWFKPWLSIIG